MLPRSTSEKRGSVTQAFINAPGNEPSGLSKEMAVGSTEKLHLLFCFFVLGRGGWGGLFFTNVIVLEAF